jgi:hypothetical protein
MLELLFSRHVSPLLILLYILDMCDSLPFDDHGVVSVAGHQVQLLHEVLGLFALELVEVGDYFFEDLDAFDSMLVILDFLHLFIEELSDMGFFDIGADQI